MATKNSMTPSGGIYHSGLGGGLRGSSTRPVTIQQQMRQDGQRQALERWKILRETQTKIFELQQDVTIQRARHANAARRAWEKFIR